MDVHTLFQLGDRTGTPLALDEDGILTLMFENDVEVTMEYDDELNVLQLYAVIGEDPLDDDIRLTLYGTCWKPTWPRGISGGTLALDDESGELLLTREIDLAVADLDHLANATEAMAETAAQWRDIRMRRCRTKARKRTANPTPWPERKRRERRG